jgi:hypothetical protein
MVQIHPRRKSFRSERALPSLHHFYFCREGPRLVGTHLELHGRALRRRLLADYVADVEEHVMRQAMGFNPTLGLSIKKRFDRAEHLFDLASSSLRGRWQHVALIISDIEALGIAGRFQRVVCRAILAALHARFHRSVHRDLSAPAELADRIGLVI